MLDSSKELSLSSTGSFSTWLTLTLLNPPLPKKPFPNKPQWETLSVKCTQDTFGLNVFILSLWAEQKIPVDPMTQDQMVLKHSRKHKN